MSRPSFETIDLAKNGAVACRYREDSFVISFGHADDFHAMGAETYLAWLASRIETHPLGHVHIWVDGAIVGQMEARPLPKAPDVGYVNLYYLAPDWRGKGLSDAMDAYICDWLKTCGCRVLRLSVSPNNGRALKFYRRRGWVDRGLRPDNPDVLTMEKTLA